MVFALVLAGYSMYRLDGMSREHKAAVDDLKKKQVAEVDSWKAKMVLARQTLEEDRAYVQALEKDNECLATKGRAYCPDAPARTERQKYIDELKAYNVARRRGAGTTVAPVQKRNPFPPER
jgi:hypothetical protein